jgi:hypothetical protein
VFRHANGNHLDAGRTANVGNARHFGDVFDFLLGLDHPHLHRRGGYIHELNAGKGILQLFAKIHAHLIELYANALCALDQALKCEEIIFPGPIRIGHIFAEAAPCGLAAIDGGTHGCRRPLGDHQSIFAPEGAIEKIREVADVVVACENAGIHIAFRHPAANLIMSSLYLARGKCGLRWLAVSAIINKAWALGSSHFRSPKSGSPFGRQVALESKDDRSHNT